MPDRPARPTTLEHVAVAVAESCRRRGHEVDPERVRLHTELVLDSMSTSLGIRTDTYVRQYGDMDLVEKVAATLIDVPEASGPASSPRRLP